MAQQDVQVITQWLTSHGFQVNQVYPNRVLIDFSGTAGQVMHAFHTEIHRLEVNGVMHVANLREPLIPSVLVDAITGIVSLHDFRPHPMMRLRHEYTIPSGLGSNYYAVVPGDLATVYNFNPVFNAGISGQGQTIVLIENTDLYSMADWGTFRSTFGLSGYSAGSLTQTNPAPPSGPNNRSRSECRRRRSDSRCGICQRRCAERCNPNGCLCRCPTDFRWANRNPESDQFHQHAARDY